MKTPVKFLLFCIAFYAAVNLGSCSNSSTGSKRNSNQVNSNDTAIISFREYEHDFGKVVEGEKVACEFIFTNTGKGPLVISSVTSSCGCTVPKYETKPVSPGSTGSIEVVFDSSGRNGRQTKTITVSSNASKPVILVRITGEVVNK